MAILRIILRTFSFIDPLNFRNRILCKRLLQKCVTRNFFIKKKFQYSLTCKRLSFFSNNTGFCKCSFQFNRSSPCQIDICRPTQHFCFFFHNFKPTIHLLKPIHTCYPQKPLLKVRFDMPPNILRYGACLLFRICSKKCKYQFSLFAKGMNVLLFKIYIHSDCT